jgi:dolichyl-phosphate beta-glucosyltransferase
MQKTCIIIPCYNEAKRIDKNAFQHFAGAHPYICFCFVNDGSTDTTINVLEKLKSQNPQQFHIIDLPVNKGKGEAVRQGVLQSMNQQSFDLIGYFDADLSTSLEEIDNLHRQFTENPGLKIVFGSRKKTKHNNIQRNILRHNFGRVYAWFTTFLLGLPFYDTQCGAKLLTKDTAVAVFKEPFTDKWLFDLEIFCRHKKIQGKAFRQSVKEQAVQAWKETGHSNITFLDVLAVPYKTFKIFFKYR